MRHALLLLCVTSFAFGCVEIEGDRIVGRDLAAAEAAFGALRPGLDLGPAPVAGSARVLRGPELQRIAKEHGIALSSSADVCFQRTASGLNPQMLKDVLTKAYGGGAEIEVLDYSRTPLPTGELKFAVSGLGSNGTWRGQLVYGDNRSVPVWARVAITDSASGKALVQSRAAAQAEVSRGQTIRVEVSAGAVLLAFDAAAESSGHVGEAITVRNPATGQRFRAVVEAKGKVGVRK